MDKAPGKPRPGKPEPGKGTSMVKDPVCGMQVDEKKAGAISAYKGTTYHFCSPTCKSKFDATPDKFTGKGGTPAGK